MSDEQRQTSEDGGGSGRGRRSLPLDRFNAFSDGVFAIAITLLVLEIAVPLEGVPLPPALREMWPEFLGYYISFAFIGGIWITHSNVTKYMKRGDPATYALNLVLLLFVGLLPFATSLMVTHLRGDDAGIATLIYGADLLLASLVLSLLISYVAREPALLVDDIDEGTLRSAVRQRWVSIGVNAVALAVALVAPQVAAGLYLVASTMLLVVPLLGLRRHRRESRAA
ncbi:MAG TPA: TMEM175 family protein [Thermoleophilia bacterium]|nr:TMEM175 family protein [Thermoleophilia bacterium]